MFPAGIVRFPLRTRHLSRLRSAISLMALGALSVLLIVAPASASGAWPSVAPVSSANARFIEASYTELLGRGPDAAGLDYQLARIAAGGDRSRHVLAYSLLFSVEGSRQEVRLAYQELLGRPGDAAGEAYWTDLLATRRVLELRVLLVASDEYYIGNGGTNQAWLDALYGDVLGRAIDGPGQAYWLGLLNTGLARASIAGAIHRSDEALGRQADSYYQDTLGRSPTVAERQVAVATVRALGERDLRARVWASDEAFNAYLVQAWL